MKVYKWDADEAAMRAELEALGYSVSKYVYPPGTFFGTHTHEVDKIDGVLAGQFRMITPEGEIVLQAGDALVVPRRTAHSAEVVGDEPVVSLDAIRRG